MVTKKKIPVQKNTAEATRLTKLANENIAKLNTFQEYAAFALNREVSAEETIAFIKDLQTLHKAVNKFYTAKIKQITSVADLINSEDAELLLKAEKEKLLKKLEEEHKTITATIKLVNIPLDKYILKDIFVFNDKIKRVIDGKTTKYASNSRQIELLKFAERLSKVIQDGLTSGVITTNALQPHVSKLFKNVDTGEVDYAYISRR